MGASFSRCCTRSEELAPMGRSYIVRGQGPLLHWL